MEEPLAVSAVIVLDIVLNESIEPRTKRECYVARRRSALGNQIDAASNRVSFHFRQQLLGDFISSHEVGRNRVQRDLTAGVLG